MRRFLLPLALALSLPAYATLPAAETSAKVATAVERASEAWTLIKATSALWLPRLSHERQEQVARAIAIGDQAVATARIAATAAEASAALARVNDAAAVVTTEAGPTVPPRS